MNFKTSEYKTLKNDYLKFLKKKEAKGKPLIDKIVKFNKFYLHSLKL